MGELSALARKVLLALGDLEPATLEQLARRTNTNVERLKEVITELAEQGLLKEK